MTVEKMPTRRVTFMNHHKMHFHSFPFFKINNNPVILGTDLLHVQN